MDDNIIESKPTNGKDIEEVKRFGNYEIIRPIGKGKFAVVYRAKRIDTDEIVALKKINVDLIDDKTREKCLKEIKLLQSLDHPNIIKYYDSFITANDLVIIVEWAAAGDLKRQIRKQQDKQIGFEERLIWKYFSQIADAISHMHDKRIMHRDLKPANIFLTLDGTVKVGDLGLSRELSENTIQAHSKVGTPLYMASEVLQGDGYDFSSDIWSLGCILYELVVLKSPFKSEGMKLYALFQKISQGDYEPLPDSYSQQLRDLTTAMLQTKPTDRPQIGYICNVAKAMRVSTHEAYMKERKSRIEPPSNQTIPAGPPPQLPPPMRESASKENTPQLQIRKYVNSTISDDMTDTDTPKNERYSGGRGSSPEELHITQPKSSKLTRQTSVSSEAPTVVMSSSVVPEADKQTMLTASLPHMDVIYTRLTVLNYPQEILPLHFATNLSTYKSIAGYSTKHATQYRDYLDVVVFCLKALTTATADANHEMDIFVSSLDSDPPMLIAKQMLRLAQQFGVDSQSLQELSPSSLCVGYGENPCKFLVALTGSVLQHQHFHAKPCIYDSVKGDSKAADDLLDEEENDGDGIIDDEEIMEDVDPVDDFFTYSAEMSRVDDSEHHILEPSIDPISWKEEFERVSSKLVSLMKQDSTYLSWGSRVDQVATYRDKVLSILCADVSSASDGISLFRDVDIMKKSIIEQMDSIQRSESMINSKMSNFGSEYAAIKKECDTRQEIISRLSINIDEFTNTLSTIADSFDNVNAQLQDKVTDDSNSGVIRMKEAIQAIKRDILKLDLDIGMSSSCLLEKRINRMKIRQEALAKKRQKSKLSTSRSKRQTNDEIEDLLEY